MKNFSFVFFSLVLILPTASYAQTDYTITPPDSWVLIQSYDKNASPENKDLSSIYSLLHDTQINATLKNTAVYSRSVYRITTQAGLDVFSDISIKYDPSYEKVQLHDISIYRNGERINKLEQKNISVLQKEEMSHRQMYDGEKSLHTILKDVRIGDIIDYSYTIEGWNPAFKNIFFYAFSMEGSFHEKHMHRRLLWPQNRKISIKNHKNVTEPKIIQHGTVTEYVWEKKDAMPVALEAGTPSWYNVYAYVEVSEFGNWQEAIEWEKNLFKAEASRALQGITDRIQKEHDTPSKRLLAALKFSQEEIRYVSVSLGEGGLIPAQPEETLKLRYGDCKSKSLLLKEMLNALGIKADIALVHTKNGPALYSVLPRPVFNHVIVKAQIAENIYWLDPTITYQSGDIDHIYQPDYQAALVLGNNETQLQPMKAPKADPTLVVDATYDMSNGFDAGATLTMSVTGYQNVSLSYRASLDQQGEKRFNKDSLDIMKKYYATVERVGEALIKDNKIINSFSLEEKYKILDMRSALDASTIQIKFPYLKDQLPELYDIKRSTPFSIPFPLHTKYNVKVILPKSGHEINLESKNIQIKNNAFEAQYSYRQAGNVVQYDITQRTLADHVSVTDMLTYRSDLDKFAALISMTIIPLNASRVP